MDSLEFCRWLQGFFELSEEYKLTEKQVQMIKNHLQLVFTKVTSCSEEQQPINVEPKQKEKRSVSETLKDMRVWQGTSSDIKRYC